MKRNIAYRYRAYPDEVQAVLLQKTFGCARFIWNQMLADIMAYYEKEHKALYPTPAQYKGDYEWLKEVDSLALANVQFQLKQAFQRFFKDKKTGYPNFKSKRHSRKSYTTNLVNGNIMVFDHSIRLPKLGEIKIKKHRTAPENWKLKSVTVTQEPSGKYYVSVLYEYESQVIEQNDTEKTIGLDFAMSGLFVDSDGYCAEMPHFLRNSEKRLRKAQRKLSKMYVKGKEKQSNRYYKQKHRVAVLHEKVRHQRADWLHKESRKLIERYDYIGIENLDMKGMSQSLHFGKSVSDNGWGMFVNMLSYKAEMAGKHVIKADKMFPSSQMCHECGCLNPETKDLKVREWDCPVCGAHHDRDHNAALNLKTEALRIALL
ncbi:MAG: transposase [Solobacterium sp.]|nr:transposase [Solobacterium sp.]